MARPDLGGFEPRAIYRNSYTGEVVEFLGVASMPELDGEEVGVFRFVERDGYFIATTHGYSRGERFPPAAAEQDVDEATTAEWRAFVEGDET